MVFRFGTDSDRVVQQLSVRLDDGEEVVEVVGDAARQLADGLQLLSLPELIFELLSLGPVLEKQQGTGRFGRGEPEW